MRTRHWFLLTISIWLIYVAHFNPYASGASRYVYLVGSVVEQHSFQIDHQYIVPGEVDVIYRKGHMYSDNNPGVSLLAAPAWFIVHALAGRFLTGGSGFADPWVQYGLRHFVAFLFTTALAGAMTSTLIGRYILARTNSVYRALSGVFILSFSSIVFFFSARLQQNIMIMFFCTVIFILLFAPELITRRLALQRILLGLAYGLAVLTDLSIAPFIILTAYPVIRKNANIRSLAQISLGFVPPVLFLMYYLNACFGSPVTPTQAYLGEGSLHTTGFFGMSVPDPRTLAAYLVSLGCGIFVFMPWTLTCIFTALRPRVLHRSHPADSSAFGWERLTLIAVPVVYWLYSGTLKSALQYGFGPRYLIPALPFLVMLLAVYASNLALWRSRWLVLMGLLVNISGAQLGIDVDNIVRDVFTAVVHGPSLPMLAVLKNPQFETAFKGSFSEISALGVFLWLAVALAVMWTTALNWQKLVGTRMSDRPRHDGAEQVQ